MLLRTVDVEQLIEPDHAARCIWEFVGRLNLDCFFRSIRSIEGYAGRSVLDPQLLISLWIYAYSRGVGSAREISRLCEIDPAFQWLTGMESINHHTLSDFRVDHREALDELFTQALGLLNHEGLITLERVMQDGTKVRAHAHPKRPGPTLTSCRLIRTAITAGVSRVTCAFLRMHVVTNSPASSMEAVRSYSSISGGLPHLHGGSAPALGVSGPARCSLTLQPACSRSRFNGSLHRRLRRLRYLCRRFDCYRVERTSSRAGLNPAEKHRLFTAHAQRFPRSIRPG